MTDAASDLKRAIAAAERWLVSVPVRSGDMWAIVQDAILQCASGWIFPWTSQRWLDSGKRIDAVAGTAPLLVDCQSWRVVPLGTALPAEEYVRRLEQWRALPEEVKRHWGEFMEPGELLRLAERFMTGGDMSARHAARIVAWIDTNGAADDRFRSFRELMSNYKNGSGRTSSDAARRACTELVGSLRPRAPLPECPECGPLDEVKQVLYRGASGVTCREEATCRRCGAEIVGYETLRATLRWAVREE